MLENWLARLFREHGLTLSQYNVLRILPGVGKPLPCLEIAERMIQVAPAITRVVDQLTNGIWTNQQIEFEGFGAAENPITLRAETPGQVILNGNSSLDISGDWLHVTDCDSKVGAQQWSHC